VLDVWLCLSELLVLFELLCWLCCYCCAVGLSKLLLSFELLSCFSSCLYFCCCLFELLVSWNCCVGCVVIVVLLV
jgi:hypothetical protein